MQHRRFQTKDVSTSDIPASEGRDKYSYRIQNLEPKTTYMISVAAVNEYGSNFNDESGHLTLEPRKLTFGIDFFSGCSGFNPPRFVNNQLARVARSMVFANQF